MAVKIVTDSGSDLPAGIARELEITVVPVYIYFGEEAYRDWADIGPDELYKRLVEGPVHPTTTQPMPVDFTNAYKELSKGADAIVSIHLPAALSGTYNSALQGREMAEVKCPVEVVDSFSISMGLGLVVMAAARVAQAGGSLSEVMEETRKAIDQVEIRGLLDTLTYLLKGGRITRAKATVGSLLNIKPILKTVNGELIEAARARSFSKGMDMLFEFVKDTPGLQEVAIVHSTVPEEANSLKERLSSIIGEKRIHMARLGPGLGVHGGPGTLLLAVRKS